MANQEHFLVNIKYPRDQMGRHSYALQGLLKLTARQPIESTTHVERQLNTAIDWRRCLLACGSCGPERIQLKLRHHASDLKAVLRDFVYGIKGLSAFAVGKLGSLVECLLKVGLDSACRYVRQELGDGG